MNVFKLNEYRLLNASFITFCVLLCSFIVLPLSNQSAVISDIVFLSIFNIPFLGAVLAIASVVASIHNYGTKSLQSVFSNVAKALLMLVVFLMFMLDVTNIV